MIKHLLAGLVVLTLLAQSRRADADPHEYTKQVPAAAREVLDTPFHFLLRLPGYEASKLVNDADLFSAWGELLLVRKADSRVTRSEARTELLRSARRAGWRRARELPDVVTPDLERYGIVQPKEDLAMAETAASPGQNPLTRYGCRIWISDDGRLIVAAYRVDGE